MQQEVTISGTHRVHGLLQAINPLTFKGWVSQSEGERDPQLNSVALGTSEIWPGTLLPMDPLSWAHNVARGQDSDAAC